MTTMDTMSQQALQIGQALLTAFNDADWPRFREMLAPTIVYEETGTGRRLEGVEAYMAALAGWKEAIPNARGSIRQSLASGDTAMFELVWEGIHSGPLETPGGPIPASGKQIYVQAALVSTVQNGKVTGVRHYLDVLTLLQQIGAMPAPGG
jgi:steroid delta-isomerase-like uncharacterized protein